jgi:Barstar (barnase inhibitor)
MNTTLDYLFRIDAPWVFLGCGEPERLKVIPSAFYARPAKNACVRVLRGNKMRTEQDLMNEISAALQFFEGFGENWYALEECLRYLDEWLPADAYIMIVESADEVLIDDDEQLWAFLKTVHLAGEWWSKPIADNGRFNRGPVPFHVLLHLNNEDPVSLERFRDAAQKADVSIRR